MLQLSEMYEFDTELFEVFLSTAYTRVFGQWADFGYDTYSDLHFRAAPVVSGDLNIVHGIVSFGSGGIIRAADIHSVYVKTDAGYRVEMQLPWSYVMGDTTASEVTFQDGVFSGGKNSALYGGERNFIGFDLHLQDNDNNDSQRDTKVAWNSGYDGRRGDHHVFDTSVWGTLVLVPIDTWNMKEALFSVEPWIDMGGDFVFNLVEERFYYIGFNRYAYDFADESWWYIHEDGAKPDGFFIYDFTQEKWFYLFEGLKLSLD